MDSYENLRPVAEAWHDEQARGIHEQAEATRAVEEGTDALDDLIATLQKDIDSDPFKDINDELGLIGPNAARAQAQILAIGVASRIARAQAAGAPAAIVRSILDAGVAEIRELMTGVGGIESLTEQVLGLAGVGDVATANTRLRGGGGGGGSEPWTPTDEQLRIFNALIAAGADHDMAASIARSAPGSARTRGLWTGASVDPLAWALDELALRTAEPERPPREPREPPTPFEVWRGGRSLADAEREAAARREALLVDAPELVEQFDRGYELAKKDGELTVEELRYLAGIGDDQLDEAERKREEDRRAAEEAQEERRAQREAIERANREAQASYESMIKDLNEINRREAERDQREAQSTLLGVISTLGEAGTVRGPGGLSPVEMFLASPEGQALLARNVVAPPPRLPENANYILDPLTGESVLRGSEAGAIATRDTLGEAALTPYQRKVLERLDRIADGTESATGEITGVRG